jgi:alpha-tubulin suppressor-like RCC1 family protein
MRRRVPVAVVLFALAVLAGCYRPRLVDCVLSCNLSHACPGGMTCAAGLCTGGTTCVTDAAAGGSHSCVVRGGAVSCFGANSHGQLGTGDTQSRGGGAEAIPIAVELSGRKATAVVAGGRHSCALAAADREAAGAVCWGDNARGQLGVPGGGTRGARPEDAFDTVPVGRPITALAAGLAHTCARLDDGSVVCWGDDRLGQLGVPDDGAGNAAFTPTPLDERAVAVSAGAYHTCALLESGAVRCWGWNDYGQLGGMEEDVGTSGLGIAVPIPPATAIAAGAFHTCALLESGSVTCWGLNDAGQLGIPNLLHRLDTPPGTAIALGAGRTAHAIGAGTSHSCALLDDFTIKCWGFNAEGELGIGATQNSADSELGDHMPSVALGADPAAALTVGAHHACAIQKAGVKCWGLGSAGQLGTGDLRNRGDVTDPTLVFATLAPPP